MKGNGNFEMWPMVNENDERNVLADKKTERPPS